jgi:hypothetical protein
MPSRRGLSRRGLRGVPVGTDIGIRTYSPWSTCRSSAGRHSSASSCPAVGRAEGGSLNMRGHRLLIHLRVMAAEPADDLAAPERLIELAGTLRQQRPDRHGSSVAPRPRYSPIG